MNNFNELVRELNAQGWDYIDDYDYINDLDYTDDMDDWDIDLDDQDQE